jgi:hypothetical protein
LCSIAAQSTVDNLKANQGFGPGPETSRHCRTADPVDVAIKNSGQWWIVIITFCILLSPWLDHGLFGELSSQRFIG